MRTMLLCVPVLAACAAPVTTWEKPGAGPAAVDEDLQRCRMEARLSPQPHSGPLSPKGIATPGMDRMEDRDANEAQRIAACMKARGYSAKR